LKNSKTPIRRISQVVIQKFKLILVVAGDDHVDIFQVIKEAKNI
jgi:hypothetical protein